MKPKTQKRKTKTLLKAVLTAMLAVVLLIMSILPTSATSSEPEIMPLFYNCNYCFLDFYIDGGVGTVTVDYCANSQTFTQLRISVKIQKRTLGIFWTTVDIGTDDNTWTIYSTIDEYFIYERFPIESIGTYRAVFDLDFYGTGGTVDEIDDKLEFTYV